MLTTLKSFLAGLMLAGLVMDNSASAQNATESQIIALTNNHRVQNGKARLAVNAVLQKVASRHAQNMAQVDQYGDDEDGHILFGKRLAYRVSVANYPGRAVWENVAWNLRQADPGSHAVTMWINSPGHNANLLNAEVTEFGVGAAQGASGKWYFAQVFGHSTPAPPSTSSHVRDRSLEDRHYPNQKLPKLGL